MARRGGSRDLAGLQDGAAADPGSRGMAALQFARQAHGRSWRPWRQRPEHQRRRGRSRGDLRSQVIRAVQGLAARRGAHPSMAAATWWLPVERGERE